MSRHYSSFHRGPEEYDPPPAYTPVDPAVGRPPAHNPSAPTAPPGGDSWQNQSNERREAYRQSGHQRSVQSSASHVTPSTGQYRGQGHMTQQYGGQSNFTQQVASQPGPQATQANSFPGTAGVAPHNSQPSQPPAGPFYPSNGASPPAGPFYGTTEATSTHPPPPSQSVQSTTGSRSSAANQRPSQGASSQSRTRQATQRYNSDTAGVSAHGGTSGMGYTASRVDSDLNIRAGEGGGCCAIL